MTLSHIATIGAIIFGLSGVLVKCICDCWRIGCCKGKPTIHDGYGKFRDNSGEIRLV